ncbi:MAG TPA: hypothetical protein VGN73_14625 [Gemmatimonadaceae bacterium]|nr:hypothetical protein [Gemmatimonadaceae bacterium]
MNNPCPEEVPGARDPPAAHRADAFLARDAGREMGALLSGGLSAFA